MSEKRALSPDAEEPAGSAASGAIVAKKARTDTDLILGTVTKEVRQQQQPRMHASRAGCSSTIRHRHRRATAAPCMAADPPAAPSACGACCMRGIERVLPLPECMHACMHAG